MGKVKDSLANYMKIKGGSGALIDALFVINSSNSSSTCKPRLWCEGVVARVHAGTWREGSAWGGGGGVEDVCLLPKKRRQSWKEK